MGRTLLAVFGGWFLIQGLVLAADALLTRLFPDQHGNGLPSLAWPLGFRLAASFLATMAGGWLAARLAPERPWRHALYLIVLGETMGILMAGSSLGQLPFWYLGGMLLLYPVAVLGGAALSRMPARRGGRRA
jgi:hypothetical protein